MELLEESEMLNTLPDARTLIQGFQKLTEKRYLLLKRGKILKLKIFRYVTFTNDSLTYYTTPTSQLEKGKISLQKSIAVPFISPIPQYQVCIKIMTYKSSEFYIFCHNENELEIMMNYIKLASNSMLQSVLDKLCFNAIGQEFQALNDLKTPKNLKLDLLTPKNVISRFLFSPTADGNFDAPEENIVLKFPKQAKENIKGSYTEHAEIEETIIEVQEMHTEKLSFFQTNRLLDFKILEEAPIEEIRELGVKYMWNYQLEYARKTFETIEKHDVRSSLFIAETFLFRLLITGRKCDIKSSMEKLEEFEKIVQVSEEPFSEIFLAEFMLFKSIVLVVTGQKFKAFISLRNCWKTYKKYENAAGQDLDVRARVELGLGLFLLLISLSPISISTILRLAGFSSDRAEGLGHLHKCYELNSSRSPYAGILLSLFYIDLEPDIAKATNIIENLSEKYPGCVLFHWVNSIISWKNNQLECAIEYLNKALRYCGEGLSNEAAFIKYELGWFYFLRFEWSLARKQFESILLETLSLSSELDSIVKDFVTMNKLENSQKLTLENLCKGKKQSKKNKNWLESDKNLDRVYLPHKSCLITQFVSCMATLEKIDETWLKIIQASANTGGNSDLDNDFGGLSYSFQCRKSTTLLPYEVIYFMKQHTKLLPYMLLRIFTIADEVLGKIDKLYKENWPEYTSAKMLQIMALALNGDTTRAMGVCNDALQYIDQLPSWALYIAPHTLYWCSRVYIVEDRKPEAAGFLKKAKRYKNYIFDIHTKIDRVLTEMI